MRFLHRLAASLLGKHGNKIRRERERERIRSTARQMCRDMGRPIPKALKR